MSKEESGPVDQRDHVLSFVGKRLERMEESGLSELSTYKAFTVLVTDEMFADVKDELSDIHRSLLFKLKDVALNYAMKELDRLILAAQGSLSQGGSRLLIGEAKLMVKTLQKFQDLGLLDNKEAGVFNERKKLVSNIDNEFADN